MANLKKSFEFDEEDIEVIDALRAILSKTNGSMTTIAVVRRSIRVALSVAQKERKA